MKKQRFHLEQACAVCENREVGLESELSLPTVLQHGLRHSRLGGIAPYVVIMGILTMIGLMLPACRTAPLHGASQPTTVTREFRSDQIRVNLELAPAVVGEMSTMAVRISDSESGARLSGADVRLNVQPVSDPMSSPPGMKQPIQELRTEEGPENGLYRVAHRFEKSGKYDLTIMVHQAGEQTASATALTTTIEVTTPAPSDRPEKSNGFTRLAMAGGAAMAACMVIMMAVMGAIILL